MFVIKHPIANAAMEPFRTTELAIAVSEAGGFGMISHANQSMKGREPDAIVAMKKKIRIMLLSIQMEFSVST